MIGSSSQLFYTGKAVANNVVVSIERTSSIPVGRNPPITGINALSNLNAPTIKVLKSKNYLTWIHLVSKQTNGCLKFERNEIQPKLVCRLAFENVCSYCRKSGGTFGLIGMINSKKLRQYTPSSSQLLSRHTKEN